MELHDIKDIVNNQEWRFRQFEVRSDGLVFWAYDKTYKGGQRWVTWDNAIALLQRRRERGRGDQRKLKRWQEWYAKNKEKKDAQTREWQRKNHRHLVKYASSRATSKAKEDPLFALKQRLRKRTSKAFSLMGYPKGRKTAQMLGCSWDALKTHIESKFTTGMSWENRHLWHIDHIIPLASAKSEGELEKLCHYLNLQPLWATDNLKKGDKLPIGHIPSKYTRSV